MKTYLIYLAQSSPNFRLAELESLADYYGIKVDFSDHNEKSPFMKVQLESDEQACKIMERSILAKGIYELLGEGTDLETLHSSVRERCLDVSQRIKTDSFKFEFIGYLGRREKTDKTKIIESFAYLNFEGPIRLKDPEHIFTVIEEYPYLDRVKATVPLKMWFGRQVQLSARTLGVLDRYDLKKRKYIGTTSFDAELAFVSCNIGQVGPGKIAYDPFCGTGSFLVAAAQYGAMPLGSDIDIRVLRGKSDECNIKANFKQYGTSSSFMDILGMDFTNNAFRDNFQVESIICDPPYGVREGLKVCGAKHPEKVVGRENVVIDGEKAHLRRDFIPPKKPYELSSLLDDLLSFAAERLPVDGRIVFWMPTANDDFQPSQIPQHENLELVYNLQQDFNKWSRRLLTYVKRPDDYKGVTTNGLKTQQIKNFRERYFTGFSHKSK